MGIAGDGKENVFYADRHKLNARFAVINLTKEEAFYKFLSACSGTHFVAPRHLFDLGAGTANIFHTNRYLIYRQQVCLAK